MTSQSQPLTKSRVQNSAFHDKYIVVISFSLLLPNLLTQESGRSGTTRLNEHGTKKTIFFFFFHLQINVQMFFTFSLRDYLKFRNSR